MASLPIVEDLNVLEHCIREIGSGAPLFPIEQLDLHARPERFHHRVVVTVSDCPKRWHQPGGTYFVREGPRGELGAMVRMNDPAGRRLPGSDGHVERVDDEVGILSAID